jgi:hypothetical protein
MRKIYFISGPLDLEEDEWRAYYQPAIDAAVASGARFVVGDARGCDTRAQTYLRDTHARVTVYHMFARPRNLVAHFQTRGNFRSDEDRDAAMTRDSHADIALVRDAEKIRAICASRGLAYDSARISGTARNIQRRKKEFARHHAHQSAPSSNT